MDCCIVGIPSLYETNIRFVEVYVAYLNSKRPLFSIFDDGDICQI